MADRQVTFGPRLPRLIHRLAGWLIANVAKDNVFASIFGEVMRAGYADSTDTSRHKTVTEYWEFTDQRDRVVSAFRKAVRSCIQVIY